jgi:uncharacterized damage-inducible protein DinB
MRYPTYLMLCCALALTLPAFGQSPILSDAKGMWDNVKNFVLRAAEKMPEENYAFKPAPEVRSFGQLVGHVADAQFMICSMAKGEKRSMAGVEKSKTAKADLVAALKESADYCDSVYAGMADAAAGEMIKIFGRERSRLGALFMNTSHSNEHYGNMVTYMRIKGLVPPSSEPRK